MWYICDGCDIYVICCVCSDRKQKTKKKQKKIGHFAECNTRQRAFAECLLPWHSAKLPKNALPSLFAECQYLGTRQSCVHYHVFHSFAECQGSGTRQRIFQKKIFFLCRVPSQLVTQQRIFQKKNSLPSAGSGRHSAKDFSKKKGKALPSAFLTRHSAKTPSTADGQFSLPSAVLALDKEIFFFFLKNSLPGAFLTRYSTKKKMFFLKNLCGPS